jgi:hypothetical protein
VLKNVKGSIFFPEPQLVSPSRGPESNLSEIKTWSQASAIILKKTYGKKDRSFFEIKNAEIPQGNPHFILE